MTARGHQLIVFLEAGRINPGILNGEPSSPGQHSPQTNILTSSHMTRRLDINGGHGLGSAIQCQDFCMPVSLGLFFYDGKMATPTLRVKLRTREERGVRIVMVPFIGKVKVPPRLAF